VILREIEPNYRVPEASRLQQFWGAYFGKATQTDIRSLTALNAIVWTIATLTLFFIITKILAGDLDAETLSQEYWPWIRSYYFPRHKFEIAAFAIVVMDLGLLALVTLYQFRRPPQNAELQRRRLRKLILVGAAASILNLLVGSFTSLGLASIAELCFLFAVSIALPVLPNQIRISGPASVFKLCTLLLLAEVVVVCVFFGAGFLPIASDYLEIPSTVFIQEDPKAPLEPVDTIQYINKHHLFGNHRIPDFRVRPDGDLPCEPQNQIALPQGPILQNWARENRETFYVSYPEGNLCFVGPLSSAAAARLEGLFPDHRSQIATAASFSAEAERQLQETPVSFSEADFGKKINMQLINFYHDLETQFHHHLQYLNPIKEYALGRALDKINAPYGLSFLMVEKTMRLSGKITFQSFIATMFLFQAIYIIAFVCLVQWLLRSWPSTLGVTAVLVGSFTGLGFTTMYEGFGYGPARHALDLLVIFSFALYLRKLDGRILLAAAIAATLNLGLDRFVGSFCACALGATLILRALCNITPRPRLEAFCGGGLAISVVGGFIILGRLTAENPFAEQFLAGVWGFPIDRTTLFLFLGWLCSASAVTTWSIGYEPDQRKSIAIFLIVYSVIFAFYWLMVPNYGHLYKVFPFIALATVVIWRECMPEKLPLGSRRTIGLAGILLSLLIWGQLSRFMVSTGIEKLRYFNAHRSYEWSFSSFRAKSTMDPAAFKESVNLIDRYTGPQDEVSILSEYDSILLFLSDRISAMPHFEIATFLNSPSHSQTVINDIKSRRPATLIVDSCIHCSPTPYRLVRPVPSLNSAYLPRAFDKVDRLQRLRDVFAEVEEDYTLVAPGPLVSVWKRK
jgi:hypothetical protein